MQKRIDKMIIKLNQDALITDLLEAQNLLGEALELIRYVADATDDDMARAFLIPAVNDYIDHRNNRRVDSIDKMIVRLGKEV